MDSLKNDDPTKHATTNEKVSEDKTSSKDTSGESKFRYYGASEQLKFK